ncbi:MAG: response regulator transcription factor [Clostridiales bacterium]|nr:response regulator transcription factor [Clostridiales bacterium]
MAAKKILLVDDDLGIIEVLRLYFEKEGYVVSTCSQGDMALAAVDSFKPDIILLDLMLPGMDGNDICRELRKTSDIPVIMLTARTDTLDKVLGLELGADDYIAKPFEPKEVLARVKAVLRRSENKPEAEQSAVPDSSEIITYPGFSVDKVRYVVTIDGEEIFMPPKELELLFFLASNPNRVFTREQLLENVWGYDVYVESRTVDVHIKRIRAKIEKPDVEHDWYIQTIWSKGYKFVTK